MYDSIVVGSGPISILEALHLDASGRNVLLIEEAPQLGGAWGTIQWDQDLPALEIGCHIWDVDQEVYQFLRDYLKLELTPLSPSPQIHAGNLKVHYGRKNLLIAGKNALSAARRGNAGSFAKQSGMALKSIRFSPPKYEYPAGGATALMLALQAKLNTSQVEVRTSVQLESLRIHESGVAIQLNGDTIESQEVVMTTFTRPGNITLPDGKAFQLREDEMPKRRFIHFHLELDDEGGKPFSYLRIMQHPIIHRVSDVTGQVRKLHHLEPHRRYVLVGIHESAVDRSEREDLLRSTLSYLRTEGLVGKNASLIRHHYNEYATQYFGGDLLTELLAKTACLRSLHSTNLIYGMQNQLKRWRKNLR